MKRWETKLIYPGKVNGDVTSGNVLVENGTLKQTRTVVIAVNREIRPESPYIRLSFHLLRVSHNCL